jgi:hypothetical protein
MKEQPGYRFTEDQAAILVGHLQESIDLLSQSVAYVERHCPEDVAMPYKKRIAEIAFDIGWEVLEQGFYKKYPMLRPKDSEFHPDSDS